MNSLPALPKLNGRQKCSYCGAKAIGVGHGPGPGILSISLHLTEEDGFFFICKRCMKVESGIMEKHRDEVGALIHNHDLRVEARKRELARVIREEVKEAISD